MVDCHKCMFCAENEYNMLMGDSWYCHKLRKTFEAYDLALNFTCEFYREASNRKEDA